MDKLLKGNYKIENDEIFKNDEMNENLEKIFESKASENLGGSIAFVMKDKFVVDEEISE